MVRKVFPILGVLAFLMSWTPATHAQSAGSNVTLSGESLQGIRGRTISEEYPNLVPRTGTTSNSPNETQTNNNPVPTTVDIDGREVDVVVSGPDGQNPNTNPILLNNSDRNDEVKFQLQLNQ